MKIRAILFDVYRTLLHVGDAPAGAEAGWQNLCRERLNSGPVASLDEVSAACREVVAADHAAARQAGIAFPEVDWPSVFQRAFAPAKPLNLQALEEFLIQHAGLARTVSLMPGAAEFLHACQKLRIPCGIASNAQAYTLCELTDALAPAGLDLGIFESRLTFWSFENGFSKPDPHVFRILAARLAGQGIPAQSALMIGDREDNDIRPAQAMGFQTFLFQPPPAEARWPALA